MKAQGLTKKIVSQRIDALDKQAERGAYFTMVNEELNKAYD